MLSVNIDTESPTQRHASYDVLRAVETPARKSWTCGFAIKWIVAFILLLFVLLGCVVVFVLYKNETFALSGDSKSNSLDGTVAGSESSYDSFSNSSTTSSAIVDPVIEPDINSDSKNEVPSPPPCTGYGCIDCQTPDALHSGQWDDISGFGYGYMNQGCCSQEMCNLGLIKAYDCPNEIRAYTLNCCRLESSSSSSTNGENYVCNGEKYVAFEVGPVKILESEDIANCTQSSSQSRLIDCGFSPPEFPPVPFYPPCVPTEFSSLNETYYLGEGCMQVLCVPDIVRIGTSFNATMRWCLPRPRWSYFTIDVIGMEGNVIASASGISSADEWQCGEQSFVIDMPETSEEEVYLRPVALPMLQGAVKDSYPNALAQTLYPFKTSRTTPSSFTTCPYLDSKQWNLEELGTGSGSSSSESGVVYDGIDFSVPGCINFGIDFGLGIRVSLQSLPSAYLTVDICLGPYPEESTVLSSVVVKIEEGENALQLLFQGNSTADHIDLFEGSVEPIIYLAGHIGVPGGDPLVSEYVLDFSTCSQNNQV
mmetsp:Transcript_2376/g.3424  ORF Transcript_2376/g.3424 Transcript_2376/m.3424 type:complete len:537 (+) Transcript_2376:83-1693(+)|eukprot:CAMPEP_0171451534 /NCGR_PEP_ID=MMETSP0945-20130129/8_1 /TAXON_ID=109269 /ORGANISM="Vaucheria litorea, Strain CCMP2940" /LENGTH=536 /DNA_ID=CAMNT_0011976029 /DNA_START=22 /DNA_END=1632 /DNA_ORIENTATION=-